MKIIGVSPISTDRKFSYSNGDEAILWQDAMNNRMYCCMKLVSDQVSVHVLTNCCFLCVNVPRRMNPMIAVSGTVGR